MSEAIDQPAAAGVDGPGNSAQTDDIDTEAFDRAPAPEDDDDGDDVPKLEGEGDDGGDGDTPDEDKQADDDHVEVERNGQKYRVPKALHGELLMQQDYTKKTTEHAEAVRKFQEERTTWESQREESRAALPEEHARLAVISHELTAVEKRLEQFSEIDWETWRAQVQGLPSDDPAMLKYEQYRRGYMNARDAKIDLTDKLDGAKKDLQTKEEARLTEQRTKAEAELRQAQQETGRVLAAEVKGWNNQRAAEVATFMVDDLGLQPEEIGGLTDARTWKLVDRLMKAEAENAMLKKAQTQQRTADKHEKDQGSQPAKSPKGSGVNARDPSTPRGDGLGTDEWMRRRQKQLAAKR